VPGEITERYGKNMTSSKIKLMPNESIDLFMNGRLKLIQSRDGYRFSIDAVLLSQFVTVNADDILVDLGTGCGIIPMILLLTKSLGHAFGLEIQGELATQAARNVCLNGFEQKIDVIQGDIRYLPMGKNVADLIICNPPYRPIKSGRINPDRRRAIARHEIKVSIEDILRAAGNLLRKKGRFALIYPAVRLVEILVRLRRFNLEPKRMQIHYPVVDSGAKLVLIEACLDGNPGLEIMPPLLGQGAFSITKDTIK